MIKTAQIKITETALTVQERQRMRKVFVARLLVLTGMVLPLFGGMAYIVYLAVMSIVEGKADVFSYLITLFFIWFCFAARKYIFPYFSNLRRYPAVRNKQVVETTITRITERYYKPGLPLFTVETGLGTIDTAVDVVLLPDLEFSDMREGMTVYIHRVPGMRRELLRISGEASSGG